MAIVAGSVLALNLHSQENTPNFAKGEPGDARGNRSAATSPAVTGWVFIDGELQRPPYEVLEAATGVAISGVPIIVERGWSRGGPGRPGGSDGRDGRGGRRDGGNRGQPQFGGGGNSGFGRGPNRAGW